MNESIENFFQTFFQLFVQVIQSRVDRRFFDCGLSNFLSHLNQFIWWTQTFRVDWNWFNWSNIAKTLHDKFAKYLINQFFSINKTFFLFSFHRSFVSSSIQFTQMQSNVISNIIYYFISSLLLSHWVFICDWKNHCRYYYI